MKPYGSKTNDWDLHWTGREEIIVYWNIKLNKTRARRQGREEIQQILEECLYKDTDHL